MKPATELAARISRALISASNHTIPTRTWTPLLEQTLHQHVCRDSLSPHLVSRVIDPFLLTHHSLALGFFNWASQQPGFTHDSLTYQSILKSLSLSRQFNSIHSLLKQVKARKLTLHSSIYRIIIGSLIQGNKTQKAFLVFNEVRDQIRDLGPEICNSLLAGLASDGCFDDAQRLFDEMIVWGVCFSTIGFGVFIWKLCRIGVDMDKVLGMLSEVKKCNLGINGSIVAVLIVKGLCEASRVSEALWVLDELRARECKPDFIAYSIVIESIRSMVSVADVNAALKKKRKLGVAPRRDDYREFILGLVMERRINEAKELGEVIVNGNFPMEDDVLNALIGSVSAIDPSSAISFLDYMIGKGRRPSLLTLSNLGRNLCKRAKTDELLEVFQILDSNGYFSDMESYNVIVSFLCKSGRVREAYRVLQEMKKKGLGPDISSYNSLMEACCKEDLLRPAKRLWDEMFASRCGVNLRTYSILIHKFSEIGQSEEALRLFHHMLEKEVAPDATTYTSLLEGLCEETKLEAALEVFNRSVKQDTMLARSILCSFIVNLCRKGHFLVASKLLQGLTYDIGHSDSHVILLKCLADARELSIALEHAKLVRHTSPSMLHIVSKELLASLSSSAKPEPLLQLLQAIREQCLDSDNNTQRDKDLYSNSYN